MIISILASIAIPKFMDISLKTTLLKAKNDMIVIQNALNNFHNNNILKNSLTTLDSLDEDKYLFSKILTKPFISKEKTSSFWSKESNTIYYFWISSSKNIKFTYNKDNFTFVCNKDDKNCKKILDL